MPSLILTPQSKAPFEKAVDLISPFYPMFHYRGQEDERFEYKLICDFVNGNTRFSNQISLDVADIYGAHDPAIFIADSLRTISEILLVSLGENVTGKYPFTRLYADLHLNNTDEFLFKPEVNVPGWVHDKFRHQQIYPKEGLIEPVGLEIEGGPHIGTGTKIVEKPKPKQALLTGISTEEFMAEVKKKKVVRTHKKLLDPSKVKADKCMVHDVEMEYNPIRGLWNCTVDGCRVVARPKRDADDRSVTVGVQARLIAHKGEVTLLLISDDNIALDITRFVELQDVMAVFDVQDQAKLASENGKDQFNIPTNGIELKMNLLVMGADEFAVGVV
jgi:hypothetical protein